MASSLLKLQGAEHAVDLDRGSIFFVQTATVVLRYAGRRRCPHGDVGPFAPSRLLRS